MQILTDIYCQVGISHYGYGIVFKWQGSKNLVRPFHIKEDRGKRFKSFLTQFLVLWRFQLSPLQA